MKRIFGIFCLSALVLFACDKDKDKGKDDGPFTIDPYDLVGVWACTEHIDPEGTSIPDVAAYTSMIISIKDLTHYAPYYGTEGQKYEYESMKIDGDRLILDEGKETEMILKVKKLDGKTMTWLQYPDSDYPIEESYANVSHILPGEWTIHYPDADISATINSNKMVEQYPSDSVEYDLLIYIKGGQVVIKITQILKDDEPWETEFTVLSITENRIETKQAVTNAKVVFERK